MRKQIHILVAVIMAALTVIYITGCKKSCAQLNGQCIDNNILEGSIVTFGNYPQATSSPEPLQWRVLLIDRANKRVLLLSEYVIDIKPYNNTKIDITWEKCTLRTWLNDEFKNAAFSTGEQQQIITQHLKTLNNPRFNTPGGKDTNDDVFLLSLEEADGIRLFIDNESRKAIATAHAIKNSAYSCTNENDCIAWWLRSPGLRPYNAAYVDGVGSFARIGHLVNEIKNEVEKSSMGVRPALWVKY